MENQDDLINPLARARGTGSAHDGTGHWLHQRITAVVNVPLMLWLAWSMTHINAWDYLTFTAWLGQPVNAVLMILSVLMVFYHAALGMQVVYEDYIHHHGLRLIKVVGMKLFFAAAAVACVFAILKIAFGA